MSDQGKPDVKGKDLWDKIGSLTPLLIGLAVTGVGTYFTNIYNFRQLQLNQVEALDKMRPLLASEKVEDRTFAYSAFAALGYEDLAIRMIRVQHDDAGGREVLTQISKTADPGTRAEAKDALDDLNRARTFAEGREGIGERDGKTVVAGSDGSVSGNAPPGFNLPPAEYYLKAQNWAVDYRNKQGGSQPLTVSILIDTYAHLGQSGAEAVGAAASLRAKPPLRDQGAEAAWDGAFLDEAEKYYKGKIAARPDDERLKLAQLWERRIAPFKKHLAAGDLALKDSSLDK
jgi:hypothetical protein